MERVGGSCMSLGDSLQLATAIHLGVTEFHTLDGAGKRKGRLSLLALNGNVAGSAIVIVQPKLVPALLPLTGPLPENSQGEQENLFDKLEDPSLDQKEKITEGQSKATVASAAEGSTNAPPSSTPSPAVSESEQSTLGGEKQKLGQQASPPSGPILPPPETAPPASTKPAGEAESGS